MSEKKQEWTVKELIETLSYMMPASKVTLLDADTDWTITKFSVREVDGEVTFYPSDFSEMRK